MNQIVINLLVTLAFLATGLAIIAMLDWVFQRLVKK